MIGYQHAALPLPFPFSPPREESHAFSRIVAGIDFSSASLAAAQWATSHVARNARAIVSYIAPPPDGAWGDDHFDRAELRELQRTSPTIFGGLDGFAATLKVASARAIVRVGRASHWLTTLVSNTRASLLVLGRRADANRRGVGEPNVLERCARRAQASVLVVPEGVTQAPRHIIAAVDGSDMAEHVLGYANELARQNGCPLIVLHVVPPTLGSFARVLDAPRPRSSVRPGMRVTMRDDAVSRSTAPLHAIERARRWLVDMLRGGVWHLPPEIIVRSGDPAREALALAKEFEAPLLVVGKRGDDSVPRGSVGSVARELLTRTRIPVLAVDDNTGELRATHSPSSHG